MKKLILSAALLGCWATAAHAMDDSERARQMALYANQVNGGAQITTTTTTAPVPMPAAAPVMAAPAPSYPLPAGAPTITASKTSTSRSLPVSDTPATTTVTQQQTTTTTTTTAYVPAATAAPVPVASVQQMSPLNDDGTPMGIHAYGGTLGQTSAKPLQVASVYGGSATSEHERQMQAWREWKSGNNGAGANTPAPYIPPSMQQAPVFAPAPAAPAPAPVAMAAPQAAPAAPMMAHEPAVPPAPMMEPAAMGEQQPRAPQIDRGPRARTPASGVVGGYQSPTSDSGSFNN